MTPSAPTPGPLVVTHRVVVERPTRIEECFYVAPPNAPAIAYFPAGRGAREDIQRANAHLYAAAPALLAFVERAEKYFAGVSDGVAFDKRLPFHMRDAARSALSSAKGGAG